jgi:hypothetical protein
MCLTYPRGTWIKYNWAACHPVHFLFQIHPRLAWNWLWLILPQNFKLTVHNHLHIYRAHSASSTFAKPSSDWDFTLLLHTHRVYNVPRYDKWLGNSASIYCTIYWSTYSWIDISRRQEETQPLLNSKACNNNLHRSNVKCLGQYRVK